MRSSPARRRGYPESCPNYAAFARSDAARRMAGVHLADLADRLVFAVVPVIAAACLRDELGWGAPCRAAIARFSLSRSDINMDRI